MGYTNNDLIPAAILLDNPGITREEFVEKLKGVRYSEDRAMIGEGRLAESVLKPFPWNLSGCKDLSRGLPKDDSAIFKFAEILNLKKRKEHLDTLDSLEKNDELLINGRVPEIYEGLENGLYGRPSLDWGTARARKKDGLFYVNSRQKSYLTGRTQFGRFTGCSEHKEGDVVFTTDTRANFYPFRIKRFAKDYVYEQLMEIEEVIVPRTGRVFYSLTELLESHPYFEPEFMIDFSQTEGNLHSGFVKGFRWRKEKSEYFLDWETFRKIKKVSGSEYHPEGSYTDLILTAEAIKHRAWKLLSAYGLAYIHEFLTTFSDSKRRYDLAIEDAYYPLQDLQEGNLDPTEFVRRSKAIFFLDD